MSMKNFVQVLNQKSREFARKEREEGRIFAKISRGCNDLKLERSREEEGKTKDTSWYERREDEINVYYGEEENIHRKRKKCRLKLKWIRMRGQDA